MIEPNAYYTKGIYWWLQRYSTPFIVLFGTLLFYKPMTFWATGSNFGGKKLST